MSAMSVLDNGVKNYDKKILDEGMNYRKKLH
jgi:hypothetical protein